MKSRPSGEFAELIAHLRDFIDTIALWSPTARKSEVARHTWEEALQSHGAIGMTGEYVLGTYVRRLALATSLYGHPRGHLARLATLLLGSPA